MQKVLNFLIKYGIYIHSIAVILFVYIVQQNIDRVPRDNFKLALSICLLALAIFNLATSAIALKKRRKEQK
ncbi:hypothetical protein [Flavobacterium silvaticum]|uniref:Uncharacterized protein n=1 Tax=Flavobacterium silvaticum TaxID=1852020 RepID=A0A972JHI2_9FLAO|nr:hypothetical protein [Flavobacterium silvaticum]NMH27960.1 hypothetical protein [Flavobacterium silvaticum]